MLFIVIAIALLRSLSISHLEWDTRTCKEDHLSLSIPFLQSGPAIYLKCKLRLIPCLNFSNGPQSLWNKGQAASHGSQGHCLLSSYPQFLLHTCLVANTEGLLCSEHALLPNASLLCLGRYNSLCLKCLNKNSYSLILQISTPMLSFLTCSFLSLLSFYFEYLHESCVSCFFKWFVCQSASLLYFKSSIHWYRLYVFSWYTVPGKGRKGDMKEGK